MIPSHLPNCGVISSYSSSIAVGCSKQEDDMGMRRMPCDLSVSIAAHRFVGDFCEY